jgi:hypothetical protein
MINFGIGKYWTENLLISGAKMTFTATEVQNSQLLATFFDRTHNFIQ